MTVGEKIRKRRIELEMTQDELAKRCGYKSRSSIQKIESSRDLPLKKVQLVAKYLDLPVSYLMGWEEVDGYDFQTQEIEKCNSAKRECLESQYYISKEAEEYAEFLHKNPEYQVLFDASMRVKPTDIKRALKALGIVLDED